MTHAATLLDEIAHNFTISNSEVFSVQSTQAFRTSDTVIAR